MDLRDDQKWRVSQAFDKLLDPATLGRLVGRELPIVSDFNEQQLAEFLDEIGLPLEDYNALLDHLQTQRLLGAGDDLAIKWGRHHEDIPNT